MACLEKSSYPLTRNGENSFCVVPGRNLQNILKRVKSSSTGGMSSLSLDNWILEEFLSRPEIDV